MSSFILREFEERLKDENRSSSYFVKEYLVIEKQNNASDEQLLQLPLTNQKHAGLTRKLPDRSVRFIVVTNVSICVSFFRRIALDLFLPLDFPESVGPSYLEYQLYDSIQGLSSYLRGVISTSAVLTAAGVGSSEASAYGAAMTWALRDGIGMVGGLVFSYVASPHFDSHVKEFRLFADIINDVGLTLDMIAPLVEQNRVMFVTILATMCKVMCGMSAGATKASITAHFALRGNMADLNAKESTQESLVTILGMVLGVALANKLRAEEKESIFSIFISWFVFLLLTVLHVWANYKGVKLLHLNTLNRARGEVALQPVLIGLSKQSMSDFDSNHQSDVDKKNCPKFTLIAAPTEISESILSSAKNLFLSGGILLGSPLEKAFRGKSAQDIQYILKDLYKKDNYFLSLDYKRRDEIHVLLRHGATENDKLKAFLHAQVLQNCAKKILKRGGTLDANLEKSLLSITHTRVTDIMGREVNDSSGNQNTHKGNEEHYFCLETLSKQGWDCTKLYFGFSSLRFDLHDKTL
mmetsp:Transcript_33041/g.38262  ORF Transcript_33041/g.38262 Transcript_33041/m.38262 type:complete len:524 (+) Transcript_33041:123-1694(+)